MKLDIQLQQTKYDNIIIAPHPDDEVFWCWSALTEDSLVLILGTKKHVPQRGRTSYYIAKELGYQLEFCSTPDNKMYLYQYELIQTIERRLDGVSCRNIYVPAPTSQQDHTTAYQVMRSVIRPKRNKFERVYLYPYWDRKLRYNTVVKVSEQKFDYVRRYGYMDWLDYIKALNRLVAVENCLDGYAEPFSLVLEKRGA
jgi:LmbE family N-acetylglucosaminyl deacetylase